MYDGNYHDNHSVFVADDTKEHTVKVYFTTPDEIKDAQDNSGLWIQPNRASTRGILNYVVVAVSDLMMTEVK